MDLGSWTRMILSPHSELLEDTLHGTSWKRLLKTFVLGLGFCVAAFIIYRRFQPQTDAPCVTDFYSYYQSALRIRQGVAPYTGLANWIRDHATGSIVAGPYTDATCVSGAILEYSYTPFLGIILLPFTWLTYGVALFVWDCCNLLFLGGAIYAFLRAARMPLSGPWLLALTGIAMLTSPLRFDLYYAQIDVFLLFAACAALWARAEGHPMLAGTLFAVAFASEPTLLIVVGIFLWKREIKIVAMSVVTSAALILAPFVWLGGKALQDMLVIWGFYGGQYAVTITNDAPRGMLLRVLTPYPYTHPLTVVPALATVLWLLFSLLILFLVMSLIAPRPIANDSHSLLEMGFVVTATLLISPWSENGQFTWLVIPYLTVFVSLRRVKLNLPTGRKLVGGFIGALVLLFLVGDDVQYALLAHVGTNSVFTPLLVLLAATYLYPLFAISAVTFWAHRVCPPGSEGILSRSQELDSPIQAKSSHVVDKPGSGTATLSYGSADPPHVALSERDETTGADVARRVSPGAIIHTAARRFTQYRRLDGGQGRVARLAKRHRRVGM